MPLLSTVEVLKPSGLLEESILRLRVPIRKLVMPQCVATTGWSRNPKQAYLAWSHQAIKPSSHRISTYALWQVCMHNISLMLPA